MALSIFLGLVALLLARAVSKSIAQRLINYLEQQETHTGKTVAWGLLWLVVAYGVFFGGLALAAVQFSNALGG